MLEENYIASSLIDLLLELDRLTQIIDTKSSYATLTRGDASVAIGVSGIRTQKAK